MCFAYKAVRSSSRNLDLDLEVVFLLHDGDNNNNDTTSYPQLYYRPSPGVSGSTTYKVKIVSL